MRGRAREGLGDQVSPETLIGIQEHSFHSSCPASFRAPPGHLEVLINGPWGRWCTLQMSSDSRTSKEWCSASSNRKLFCFYSVRIFKFCIFFFFLHRCYLHPHMSSPPYQPERHPRSLVFAHFSSCFSALAPCSSSSLSSAVCLDISRNYQIPRISGFSMPCKSRWWEQKWGSDCSIL